MAGRVGLLVPPRAGVRRAGARRPGGRAAQQGPVEDVPRADITTGVRRRPMAERARRDGHRRRRRGAPPVRRPAGGDRGGACLRRRRRLRVAAVRGLVVGGAPAVLTVVEAGAGPPYDGREASGTSAIVGPGPDLRSRNAVDRPEYSLVIPIFNEQECLPELEARLIAVMDKLDG